MVKLVEQKRVLMGAYGFEGKNCNGVVEKTIRPDSGGIYLKFVGCNYLFKGDPKMHVHNAIKASKKIFPTLATIMSDRMMQVFLAFLFIFRRKLFWKICRGILDVVYSPLDIYRLRPERYCVSVRELRRTIEVIKIPEELQKIMEMLRDAISMNLETDIAYRFPFQDIIPEINKCLLMENPVKEIKRVIGVFNERAGTEYTKDNIDKLLVLIIRFNKKARNLLIEFVNELDYDKIKLDEADWFFCLNRYNYKFRGVSWKDRLKIRDKIYKREGKPETVEVMDQSELVNASPKVVKPKI